MNFNIFLKYCISLQESIFYPSSTYHLPSTATQYLYAPIGNQKPAYQSERNEGMQAHSR